MADLWFPAAAWQPWGKPLAGSERGGIAPWRGEWRIRTFGAIKETQVFPERRETTETLSWSEKAGVCGRAFKGGARVVCGRRGMALETSALCGA